MKDDRPPMGEELDQIRESFRRRQAQLEALQEKLRAAAASLGEDVADVPLPENMGAVLDEEPEDMDMNHSEEPSSARFEQPGQQESPVPVELEVVQDDSLPAPQVQRDPAVLELLSQSAGLVQRQEHLRISVENLDKKLDGLAREMPRWREEDERRRLNEGQLLFGMNRGEVLRLGAMGLLFIVLAIIWHFLS